MVRERVTASVVLQRRVVVRGKQGLFVVARRAPNGDGAITWAYELDAGSTPRTRRCAGSPSSACAPPPRSSAST